VINYKNIADNYENIADRLKAVRSEIDVIERAVWASPHQSHDGGQLAAHVSTARDSVSAAVSSALTLAFRTLTDPDRAVAQDGRA